MSQFSELACPHCQKPLHKQGHHLFCQTCKKFYPVKNGMAILWDKTYETSPLVKKHISQEIQIGHDLAQGRLTHREFWARVKGESYAAKYMENKAYATLKTFLPSLRGLKVLNIGCGSGSEAEWLLEQGVASVICTDVSMDMLLLAQKRFLDKPRRPAYYFLANAENLPVKKWAFDLAFFKASLHHFPRPLMALKSACSVSPVVAAVSEPATMGPFGFFLQKTGWNPEYGNLKNTHRFTPAIIKHFFHKLGYTAQTKLNFIWFPLQLFSSQEDNQTFVNIYYFLLQILDHITPFWGHNLTLLAKSQSPNRKTNLPKFPHMFRRSRDGKSRSNKH